MVTTKPLATVSMFTILGQHAGNASLLFNFWLGYYLLANMKKFREKRYGHFESIYLLFAFPGPTFACMLVEVLLILGTLTKPRQRECHQTKALKTKTIAAHVLYKSFYISLPCTLYKTRTWNGQDLYSLKNMKDCG